MATIKIKAETREASNSRAAKRLLRNNRIPAILYGGNFADKAKLSISLDAKTFQKTFKTIHENTILNLSCASKNYKVVLKDYQSDILSGALLHVDFYEIREDRALKAHIPLLLEGTAPGIKLGGLLEHGFEEIFVECLPKDLPESISIDISELALGDSIHVRDINEPQGVRFLTSAEQLIAHISIPRSAVEELEGVDESDEEEVEDANQ